MRLDEAISLILHELWLAQKKHPTFPDDPIYRAAILSEEAGEVAQAANNYVMHDGDIEALRTELAHTGAMVLRNLAHIDD